MNSSLRAKLRLAENCSKEELQEACNRYYSLYKGVLASAKSEPVADIALHKAKDLLEHASKEGITIREMTECTTSNDVPNTGASIESDFSDMTGTLSAENAAYFNRKIASLPISAKRFYLSALVVLRRKDTSPESFHQAVRDLESALREDPENIIYKAMLDDIEKEINAYTTELAQWQQQKQAEIDRERRISTVKDVFSTIGSALLWILGAVVTVAGGLLSCFCGMCDAC